MLGTIENISVSQHQATLKVCSLCKTPKSLTEFHLKGLHYSGSLRYQSACKDCSNEKRSSRYQKQKTQKITQKKEQEEDSYFKIEIVYSANPHSPTDMKNIISDFIEAVYALPS